MSAPLKPAGKPRTRNWNWNWVGFAVGVTIMGLCAFVLTNLLKSLDFGLVVAHVRAMPASQIGWAVLFIAGAYATLTCYDFFAVRALGARHVSGR